jgi:asparagine synthetase B (glutamine-hydrolysing)
MMRFDFETYLPEDVLTKVDRMSMAHSIEIARAAARQPVIDFAASLPARFKIRTAGASTSSRKRCADAAAGILDGASRASAFRSARGSAAA